MGVMRDLLAASDGLDLDSEIDESKIDQLQEIVNLKEAIWNDWPMVCEVMLNHRVMPFHRAWGDFQFSHSWTLILGPRGYGKTQICVKDYSIIKSLRSRDERILILGKTLPQARSILREIRFQLERNELVNLFGAFFDTKVERLEKSQTQLFFLGRKEIFSEPNVSALGIGGSIISPHFSCILADDLVDNSNKEGRSAEILEEWFKEEVLPMLLPGGELHLVGSSWGSGDLYHKLIREADAGVSPMKYRIFSAENERRESIWPEWISTEELRMIERRMGTPFYRAQYLNQTDMLERSRKRFFEDDCRCEKRSRVMRRIEEIVIGIDPATGEGESWTGIAVVGRMRTDPEWPKYWILDLYKEKFGSMETKSLAKAVFKKFRSKTELVVVEAVAYQATLARELQADLPVELRYPQGSKSLRTSRVGVLFQQGSVGYVEECSELMHDFWNNSGAGPVLIDAFDDACSELSVEEEDEVDYDVVDMRTAQEKRDDKYRETVRAKFGEMSRVLVG